ncbi:hypothetical protein P4S95_27065 [Aneurinibacillus aneurinilyticus]|uniref:hypothetical protein n=1 Tax=Aneurinibacillus aneurinilyticus TaxID=1391 RepID=UPI002E1A7EB1|nr:hypothetical protein [Aneurinibacillus aneurinilyticus]
MKLSLEFISKMYNNRNSYAEIFSEDELKVIHVASNLEQIIKDLVQKKKLILLTGNPGDGKTHLIRCLEDFLRKHDTFLELDINEVKDYQKFILELKAALDNNKPALIAVNEYPLHDLLQKLKNEFPYYEEINKLKKHTLVYSGEFQVDYSSLPVAIVDLNNRNLLNESILNQVFEQIIQNVSHCDSCDKAKQCVHLNNLSLISNDEIRQRITLLVSTIGNIGSHAVMRDILGFISYIITRGKKCSELDIQDFTNKYYNLMFNGNNSLFRDLLRLDPTKITSPSIDEALWNGELLSGWITKEDILIPKNVEDEDEALQQFKSMKRRYFFEHQEGYKLLELYPKELRNYLKLVRDSCDDQISTIQKLVLSINRYYNPLETENEKLFIWNSHSYEARAYPEVTISNSSFPIHNMKILVPKLPIYLKKMEYVPNHLILRVEENKSNEHIDLTINFNLYRMLMLIAEGYPPQILPNNHKFTLNRFMSSLSSTRSRLQINEFTIRSIKNSVPRKILIKDNKYLMKHR